jgi:3-hydroxyacyl-[acyl-carrier-protein] dehydratase
MTSFYDISNLAATGQSFRAEINFNPAHPLFSGHFPGKPIVPGVVLVEITSALVSQLTSKELVVKEASVIKFLHVIEPLLHPLVITEGSIVEQDDGSFKVDLAFYAGDITFAKLRGMRLACA